MVGVTGDFGHSDVDFDGAGDGGVGGGGDLLEHEAAAFGSDGGDGGLRASEGEDDVVVAFGNGDGEEEGFVAVAGAVGDGGGVDEVEAGVVAGEAGGGGERCEEAVGGTAAVLHQCGLKCLCVGCEGCG